VASLEEADFPDRRSEEVAELKTVDPLDNCPGVEGMESQSTCGVNAASPCAENVAVVLEIEHLNLVLEDCEMRLIEEASPTVEQVRRIVEADNFRTDRVQADLGHAWLTDEVALVHSSGVEAFLAADSAVVVVLGNPRAAALHVVAAEGVELVAGLALDTLAVVAADPEPANVAVVGAATLEAGDNVPEMEVVHLEVPFGQGDDSACHQSDTCDVAVEPSAAAADIDLVALAIGVAHLTDCSVSEVVQECSGCFPLQVTSILTQLNQSATIAFLHLCHCCYSPLRQALVGNVVLLEAAGVVNYSNWYYYYYY